MSGARTSPKAGLPYKFSIHDVGLAFPPRPGIAVRPPWPSRNPLKGIYLTRASCVEITGMYRAQLGVGSCTAVSHFPGLQLSLFRAGYPAATRERSEKEPHAMNRTSLVICLA